MEPMDDEAALKHAELMGASNEVRIEKLEAISPEGAGSLENVFDALRMLVYLEQIGATLGITARAELAFEGRRSEMLDKIEEKVEKFKAAQEAAQRAQVIAGGNPGGPRILRPN